MNEHVNRKNVEFAVHLTTTINFLNDDCLSHVFKFLSIKDRVKMGRVCKRWKTISDDSWHYVKILNKNTLKWTFDGRKKRDHSTFLEILRRCGTYLVELDFDGLTMNNKLLRNIGDLCPNVKILKLGRHVPASRYMIESIIGKCRDIVEFGISSLDEDCGENLLGDSLKRCRTLERIEVSHAHDLTGVFLLSLPLESLEIIRVDDCKYLWGYYVKKALEMYPNLHTLSVTRSPCVSITKLPKTLKSFKYDKVRTINRDPNVLSLFKYLETLDVSGDNVTDQLLINLADTCRELTTLTLRSCDVTDSGLRAIENLLPKLETLRLDDMSVNCSNLSLAGLKRLTINRCANIRNDDLCSLIKASSDKIERIDVSNCPNIDNANLLSQCNYDGVEVNIHDEDDTVNEITSNRCGKRSCLAVAICSMKKKVREIERRMRM